MCWISSGTCHQRSGTKGRCQGAGFTMQADLIFDSSNSKKQKGVARVMFDDS